MSSYQSNQIKLINTSLIDPHPDNPRKNIGDVTDHRRPPQARRMQTGRN